jgi:hypothetical protein
MPSAGPSVCPVPAALPDFDPAAALAAHTQAQATAAEVVCTNGACTGALTSRTCCTCTECHGDGHGTDRTGLIPARGPRPTQTARTARATAAAFAAAPDDEAW